MSNTTSDVVTASREKLDERDRAILDERVAAFNATTEIREGDFVRFADGVLRQVSYVWPGGAQTSDGGSFYLGNGYVNMSGTLYPSIPADTLTLTDETMPAYVWFFHHDSHTAGNSVHVQVTFRVWTCSLPTADKYCLRCDRSVWGGHQHGKDDGTRPTRDES
jgi:hypothetical protein